MRWIAAIYAKWHGFFWLPCPNCGRMFGGHEHGGNVLWVKEGAGQLTCPNEDCKAEVIKRNAEYMLSKLSQSRTAYQYADQQTL